MVIRIKPVVYLDGDKCDMSKAIKEYVETNESWNAMNKTGTLSLEASTRFKDGAITPYTLLTSPSQVFALGRYLGEDDGEHVFRFLRYSGCIYEDFVVNTVRFYAPLIDTTTEKIDDLRIIAEPWHSDMGELICGTYGDIHQLNQHLRSAYANGSLADAAKAHEPKLPPKDNLY